MTGTPPMDTFTAELEEAKRRVLAGVAAGIPSQPVHPPDAVPDAPPASAGKLGLLEQLYGPDVQSWKPAQLKEWLKFYKESTGHNALAGIAKPTTGDLMRAVTEAQGKLAGMPAGQPLPVPDQAPPTTPVLTTELQHGMPAGSQVLPGGSLVYPPVAQQVPVQTQIGWTAPPSPTPAPAASPVQAPAPIPASTARPAIKVGDEIVVVSPQGGTQSVRVDGRYVAPYDNSSKQVWVQGSVFGGTPGVWVPTAVYWPEDQVQTPAPAPPSSAPAPEPPAPISVGDEVMVTAPDGNLHLLKIDGLVAHPVPGSRSHVYVQGYDAQGKPAWVQAEVYWPQDWAPPSQRPPLPPICGVCGEPQFDTPSGPTCSNGHGGAPAHIPTQPAPVPAPPAVVSPPQAVPQPAPALVPQAMPVGPVAGAPWYNAAGEVISPPVGVSENGQVQFGQGIGGPAHIPDLNDPEQRPGAQMPTGVARTVMGETYPVAVRDPARETGFPIQGILRHHAGYDLFVDVIPQDRKWVDILDLAEPTIAYWNAQLDKQKPPKGTEGQVGHYQLYEWQGGIGLVVGGVLNCIEQFQGLNIVVRTRTALGKALAEALAPRARERFEGVR